MFSSFASDFVLRNKHEGGRPALRANVEEREHDWAPYGTRHMLFSLQGACDPSLPRVKTSSLRTATRFHPCAATEAARSPFSRDRPPRASRPLLSKDEPDCRAGLHTPTRARTRARNPCSEKAGLHLCRREHPRAAW